MIFLDIDGVLNRTKSATHIRLDDDLISLLKDRGRFRGAARFDRRRDWENGLEHGNPTYSI